MMPFTIDLSSISPLTQVQIDRLCMDNPDIQFTHTATGKLRITTSHEWGDEWIQVIQIAEILQAEEDPLRKQLGQHLELISHALREIKKTDNGDYSQSDGKDVIAIKAVLPSS